MRARDIIVTLVSLLVAVNMGYCGEPCRESYLLNDNWRFFYADAADSDDADYVSLPHCWDSDRVSGFHSTMANYMREVYIPESWKERRVFLRVGGAQRVAELFLNGSYVGEHHGGYTAFTFELTDGLRYGAVNYLRLIVSNNQRSDVLPTSSDMNIMGGINRDVELIVTGKDVISPLCHSSDGIFVVQQAVGRDRVAGVVRVMLSLRKADNATLHMRITDPDGYEVASHSLRATHLASEASVDIPFEIVEPMLWSPATPKLYGVEVSLGDERNPADVVAVTTGFRKISISEDNKLCINDEPVVVRGVNLPHDRQGEGVAVRYEHLMDDIAMIDDMGANAIRSLSGPHHRMLYDYADNAGWLVWIDMPFTRSPISLTDICYYPTVAFRENGFRQLEEIIMQNFNHPSVAMWGLFGLAWQRGDDVVGYIKELNDLAHKLDASRPTVGCSNADGAINFITDLIVLRQNVGWSKGEFEDVAVWCRQLSSNKMWSKLRSGVCYGEEGVMTHVSDDIKRATRGERLLPERRQTYMHTRYADILSRNDIFWGVWLDNMFDYASSRRAYGLNQSGMVCHDHRTKKDAYYLYRTLWNERDTTLHIVNRRWQERPAGAQYVDIFSSAGLPEVEVNGEPIEVVRVADGEYRTAPISIGREALISVSDNTGRHRDSMILRVRQ